MLPLEVLVCVSVEKSRTKCLGCAEEYGLLHHDMRKPPACTSLTQPTAGIQRASSDPLRKEISKSQITSSDMSYTPSQRDGVHDEHAVFSAPEMLPLAQRCIMCCFPVWQWSSWWNHSMWNRVNVCWKAAASIGNNSDLVCNCWYFTEITYSMLAWFGISCVSGHWIIHVN